MTAIRREHLHDAVICKEHDSVLEVAKIMRDTLTRQLIVVDKSLKPIGIITAFDVVKRAVAEEKELGSTNAKEIMTAPIFSIEVGQTFISAAEKMSALETFRLPVTENGKLVGILDYSVVFRHVCEVKHDD